MDILGKFSFGTNENELKLAGNCLKTYVSCQAQQSIVPTKDKYIYIYVVGCKASAPAAF